MQTAKHVYLTYRMEYMSPQQKSTYSIMNYYYFLIEMTEKQSRHCNISAGGASAEHEPQPALAAGGWLEDRLARAEDAGPRPQQLHWATRLRQPQLLEAQQRAVSCEPDREQGQRGQD